MGRESCLNAMRFATLIGSFQSLSPKFQGRVSLFSLFPNLRTSVPQFAHFLPFQECVESAAEEERMRRTDIR